MAGGRPLSRGDIVLVPFPYADMSSSKLRPAIVIGSDSHQGDFTLAFTSSQDATRAGMGEIVVLPSHPEFPLTGLSVATKIRCGKLVTMSRSLFSRWLGRLGPLLIADLDRALVGALAINTVPYREEGRQIERKRLTDLHAAGGAASVLADLGLPPT